MATFENTPTGVVTPDELFTAKAFTQRLGIQASTLTSARRAGLPVYYKHKRAYIYGRDWIDYVRNSNTRSTDPSAPDAV